MTPRIEADNEYLRATIAAMRQGSSNIENTFQQTAQARWRMREYYAR